MCTAGTCGFCGCAISEMPEAQNRGSSAAPGISLRNSGANSPCTVEQCTPTFSKTRPRMIDITPPPPGLPEWSVRLQGVRTKRPAGLAPSGAVAGRASSTASSAAQMSSRSASNQVRARVLRVSMSLESIASAYVMPGGWRAKPPACRSASPATMATATAILSERKPSRIGMPSRVSAALCTASRHPGAFAAEQQDLVVPGNDGRGSFGSRPWSAAPN